QYGTSRAVIQSAACSNRPTTEKHLSPNSDSGHHSTGAAASGRERMARNPERSRINRPFVGIPSFLRSRICREIDEFDGAIGILSVPFDEGSPFLAGSRLGPRSIREHSLRFVYGEGGFYNPETGRTFLDDEMRRGLIQDCGDADIAPTNVERSFA